MAYKNYNLTPLDIIIYGESLGTAVSIAVAQNYPVHKMILEGAMTSIADIAQEDRFPYLPVRNFLKDKWNSKERVKDVQSSFLFIHGKQDQVVPFKFGIELYEEISQPKKHIWLEGKGHGDKLEDEKVKQKILEFLAS